MENNNNLPGLSDIDFIKSISTSFVNETAKIFNELSDVKQEDIDIFKQANRFGFIRAGNNSFIKNKEYEEKISKYQNYLEKFGSDYVLVTKQTLNELLDRYKLLGIKNDLYIGNIPTATIFDLVKFGDFLITNNHYNLMKCSTYDGSEVTTYEHNGNCFIVYKNIFDKYNKLNNSTMVTFSHNFITTYKISNYPENYDFLGDFYNGYANYNIKEKCIIHTHEDDISPIAFNEKVVKKDEVNYKTDLKLITYPIDNDVMLIISAWGIDGCDLLLKHKVDNTNED